MPFFWFRKISKLSIITVVILYSLFELFLCTVMDPVAENLTGLDHLHHRKDLLTIYTFLTCILISGFTCRLWHPSISTRRIRLMEMSMLSVLISSQIPYQPDQAFWINDLHVWLCIAGFSGYLILWICLPVRNRYLDTPGLKQNCFSIFSPVLSIETCLTDRNHLLFRTTRWIIFSYGAGFAVFAWTGHISGLCELAASICLIWSLMFAVLQIQS